MATTQKGLYHPFSHARGQTVGSFQILSDAVTPTVADDPGGIVQSVSRSGVGTYVVTLKRQYSRIHCVAGTNGVPAAGVWLLASVSAILAGGTLTNTVTLTLADTALGAAADTATVITVAFNGYDS